MSKPFRNRSNSFSFVEVVSITFTFNLDYKGN
jgi:hypothetical protein